MSQENLRILTLKALKAVLTNGSGGARGKLTPFNLFTALPCSVRGAVTGEVIPHGVTHSPVETGVDLMERKQVKSITQCPL